MPSSHSRRRRGRQAARSPTERYGWCLAASTNQPKARPRRYAPIPASPKTACRRRSKPCAPPLRKAHQRPATSPNGSGSARRRPSASADDFVRTEEEVDLDLRILVAVRAVDRIGLNRFGVGLADGALGSVRGVGRAHHVAIALYRVLALEDLHDDGPGGHERAEVVVERTLAVDGIKALGLAASHADALRGNDAQAGL